VDTARAVRLHPHSVLLADIDGDGTRDRISTVFDARNRPGCRYLVLVQTAAGAVSAPIRSTAIPDDAGPPYPGDPPTADSLIEIGPKPSLQILVRVHQGASTSTGVVFDYRRGRLRQLPITGVPDWAASFVYNEGVMFIDGVDCLGGPRSGKVLQLTGGTTDSIGTRWEVVRDVFQLRGLKLVHVSHRIIRFRGTSDALVRRFPTADGRSFTSCTAAVR
jgi:hypothetical protein